MAPNYSKILTKTNSSIVIGSVGVISIIWLLRNKEKVDKISVVKRNNQEDVKYFIKDRKDDTIKAEIDKQFFKRIIPLLKISLSSWYSSEIVFLILIAGSLMARSFCDFWLISFESKIENAVIVKDRELFIRRLLTFIAVTPLLSVINNTLKYTTGELRLRLRNNITKRLLSDYLMNYTYYHMSTLDNRIGNPDQLLTTDIDKFSEILTQLYCNATKPLLDMMIYVYRLWITLGGGTPISMIAYLLITGVTLLNLRRPYGKMAALEQRLEGEFRHVNARLITYSEEIAFYNGNQREKLTLLASFNNLLKNLRRVLRFKAFMGFIDDIVTRHFTWACGFWILSLAFLSDSHDLDQFNDNERSRLYYTYGRMLIRFAAAVGRFILAGRELTQLAGLTARITYLRDVIADINAGKHVRIMISGSQHLLGSHGKIMYMDNIIKFNKVPLTTPNGDILIEELSFVVHSGMNVLVYGPNGSGKSSLFRILNELWPLYGGELTKPPREKLFYIPQKPYMTLGTLRDQLIYPHTSSETNRLDVNDKKLEEYLELVQLTYLFTREGGLDSTEDWLDVLSGGEKQRIAMARLFYHAPQFAILDECTSAVSVDVEGSMYKYCQDVGITLFTVSHRKSLWQYHDHILHLDGRGTYTFKPIYTYTEEFTS